MLGRVAGYSGFDSFNVTAVTTTKPGQTGITRDYYKDANKVKPTGSAYMGGYNRFGSNHQITLDKSVKPTDYKRVSRGGKQNLKYEFLHQPELYKYTKEGKQSQTPSNIGATSTKLQRSGANNVGIRSPSEPALATKNTEMYKTTKHWQSNYKMDNEKAMARPNSQAQRPFWSYPKHHHVARRSFYKTENQNKFGTYGHIPRKVLDHNATKLENEVSELTMGTTKVTSHIPGYGGFLVRTDLNDKALSQTKNNLTRNLMQNKTNLNENFNVKLPGYSGYKPMSFTNEKGNPRPNLFSTNGETFS
uniref:Uncharacterized protein n=1 Tax=Euplotes crassus TaxID=5936 RepID=A0A7S3NM25_EUPCR|mmetsp:Transcript_12418/g.12458  ORF Transcript_12418/g.12458 Transcript_12418/m.12458 type:complete len:304 (+) Transcript_12418:1-912(+)